MTTIGQLISILENNNPTCEISGDFRAITALRFPPSSDTIEFGNIGEICIFSETKRGVALRDKVGEIYWEYFIPHTEVSADFYGVMDRSLSIWNSVGKLFELGVEIYALNERGYLYGISRKHNVRLISERACKIK
ncbi:hypothetical protein ACS91J_15215 [Pectobacterium carotovorum]